MNVTQALVKNILTEPWCFDWSLQGMGLLRLYLTPDIRLHIWDSRYRYPGASLIHDHQQWGLHSEIVSGRLINRRYVIVPHGCPYQYRTMRTGMGICKWVDEGPQGVDLAGLQPERYYPGDSYDQEPQEIHETDAEDGTVTLMTKTPNGNDLARIFWPAGEEWGTAAPRPATPAEIMDITSNALKALS